MKHMFPPTGSARESCGGLERCIALKNSGYNMVSRNLWKKYNQQNRSSLKINVQFFHLMLLALLS